MRSLFQIIRVLLAGERRAYAQGMALSAIVLGSTPINSCFPT